jgi:uncharacterized membrane protein
MIIDQFFPTRKLSEKTELSPGTSETKRRSLVKALSWRVLGTLDTVVISWIITGTLAVAFSIGLIELFTKMGLFFVHERLWNRISWGKRNV